MQTIEENELIQSIILGRLECFRAFSEFSPLPGAGFQQNSNNSFYYCSGIDFAPCNGVIDNNKETPSAQTIDNAIDFFQTRKLPFIWWTPSKNLEKKGFQFGGILTGIALEITGAIISDETIPSHLRIKTISTKEDLKVFSTIAGLGMNPATIEQFQTLNAAGMKYREQVHFLALLDGIPVGTATLSTSHSSAGIWSLATLPEYRKRGVGTALVSAAMAEAKKLEYNQVMAILMPKGMAWGIFTKLGFKECGQFPFYVYGASAEEIEK